MLLISHVHVCRKVEKLEKARFENQLIFEHYLKNTQDGNESDKMIQGKTAKVQPNVISKNNCDNDSVYIEPSPLKGNTYYWNNHVKGEKIKLNCELFGIPKDSVGFVLGIKNNRQIDVQFKMNGQPVVISVSNHQITPIIENEKKSGN